MKEKCLKIVIKAISQERPVSNKTESPDLMHAMWCARTPHPSIKSKLFISQDEHSGL